MTPKDLDDVLDRMADAAGADSDAAPGLITLQTDVWIQTLWSIRPTCVSVSDGLRHRNIQVHIAHRLETAVLTRAQAGGRGAPYRDLAPRL